MYDLQKMSHVAAALAIDESEDERVAEAEELPSLMLAAEAMDAPPSMTLEARTLPLVSLGRGASLFLTHVDSLSLRIQVQDLQDFKLG